MATTPHEIRVTVDEEKVREAVRRTLREMAEDGDLAARLAEAEEALGRVRELADEWKREFGSGSEAHRDFGQQVVTIDFAEDRIRRALDGTR